MFSQGAFAQASSPSRADVKAEARGATKSPTGEAQTMSKQPSTMSDKTRAERKSTTRAASKAHELKEAGEHPTAMPTKGSDTTRAERKAKTKAANKAGEIPGAGEKGEKERTAKP
ncbi:MAG: hypothetical protein ABI364_09320 [Caldimonas sp.]